MVKEVMGKEKILADTGHTVGVYDASMEIKQGEVFVIMGLSGSGKSTLIRCFNLLNKPTDGAIFIEDINNTKSNKNETKKVATGKKSMVFQQYGLIKPRKNID